MSAGTGWTGYTGADESPAVDVTLSNEPRSAARARRCVDAFEGQVHPETLAKVRVLITELVAAALQADATSDIRVRLAIEGRTVRGEVASGRAAARRPRGWTLLLARRIATRWGVSHGAVWFEVDDREARPAPASAGLR